MRTSGVIRGDYEQSQIVREFTLVQASMQQAIHFVGLGANDRAAAYFQFAAQRLQGLAEQLTAESGQVSK